MLPTKKIYVVAEQVGFFNNPQYFVQLFKSYWANTKSLGKNAASFGKET